MYKILGEKNGNVFVDFTLKGQDKQSVLNSIRQAFPDIAQREQQNKLIEHCLSQYLEQENQSIWRLPHIQNVNAEPEQFNFRAVLARFPEVKLPENPQIELEVPEFVAPEEKDFQDALDNFQFRHHELRAVDRPADWGDMVTLNLYGRCENELIPHSAQLRFPLFLKPPAEPDPIMSGILGLAVGQKKTIEFALSDKFHIPELRGKKARYEIEVLEIREVLLPPLDQEFAQLLGFKDLVALLQAIVADFRKQWKTQWETKVRRLVLNKYVQSTEVNIPEAWVDNEIKQEWQASDFEHLKQMKAPKEFVMKSLDSWKQREDIRVEQKHKLKTKFVLRELIKQQNIQLTRSEIDKAISAYGQAPSTEELYNEMEASGLLNELKDTLHLEKAVDYIMVHAKLMHDGKSYTVPE